VGLESPNHYTYGLQFLFQSYLYDKQVVSTNSLAATDYNYYQIALGGERWFSSHWALRAGLIVEDDAYTQSVSLNILDTSGTVGLGFADKQIKLDTKSLLGQDVNVNNSSNKAFVTGAEIQGILFL
jgi:hypothetical protein